MKRRRRSITYIRLSPSNTTCTLSPSFTLMATLCQKNKKTKQENKENTTTNQPKLSVLYISPSLKNQGGIYRHRRKGAWENNPWPEVLAQRSQHGRKNTAKATFSRPLWLCQGGATWCDRLVCPPVSCAAWFLDICI